MEFSFKFLIDPVTMTNTAKVVRKYISQKKRQIKQKEHSTDLALRSNVSQRLHAHHLQSEFCHFKGSKLQREKIIKKNQVDAAIKSQNDATTKMIKEFNCTIGTISKIMTEHYINEKKLHEYQANKDKGK